MKKKVLLHICCGVCAFACIERLKKEGYYVQGFFFNPNISIAEEYIKRKDAAMSVGEITKVSVIEGRYFPQAWENLCQQYKDEKEGGQRCRLCYKLRLEETSIVAGENNFDYFTTTLTVSPHKNSRVIIETAKEIDKERFLSIDFKKEDGFKNSIELAKKHNLYRQNYCGCKYSR